MNFGNVAGRAPRLRVQLWAAGLITLVLGTSGCDDLPLYAPPGSSIMLTADPPVILADGKSSTRLTARIIPSSGQIADGTHVIFTTSLGELSASEARTVDGVATSSLRAGTYEGEALVQVFSGGDIHDSTGVTIGTAAEILSVTVNPSEIALDPGGDAQATATAVLSPVGKVPDGTLVNFTITRGEIDPLGVASAGIATAVVRAGEGGEGTAVVTAITGTLEDTASIRFGRVVGSVFLNARPPELFVPAGIPVSVEDTLEVFVFDRSGNPISNKSVTFTAEKGTLTPPTATTDSDGSAQSILRFQSTVQSLTTDIVAATVIAGGLERTVDIIVRPDDDGG